MEIIVGTRGSKLALTQTNWVIEQLKAEHSEHTFTVKIIKTKGDLIQNVPLDKIGDKGVFVKEIEQQLLGGEIDIAIHSMKDMPSEVTTGLEFVKTPKREDRRDALVLRGENICDLSQLREGAIIATGSKRRKYQLLSVRPDLCIVPIRGNIDTRIRKIEEENLDGIVLAAAGLKRLGLEFKIGYYLPEELMIPAPAQGALAIQIRKDDSKIKPIVSRIESMNDEIEIQAERAFLSGVNGSCNIPIGASAKVEGCHIGLSGILGDAEGRKLVRKYIYKTFETEADARAIGTELAKLTLKELESHEG
ncbi:MAG: hydroxymethylbilane synthase [Cellulosilyticaceae bacterium]